MNRLQSNTSMLAASHSRIVGFVLEREVRVVPRTAASDLVCDLGDIWVRSTQRIISLHTLYSLFTLTKHCSPSKFNRDKVFLESTDYSFPLLIPILLY